MVAAALNQFNTHHSLHQPQCANRALQRPCNPSASLPVSPQISTPSSNPPPRPGCAPSHSPTAPFPPAPPLRASAAWRHVIWSLTCCLMGLLCWRTRSSLTRQRWLPTSGAQICRCEGLPAVMLYPELLRVFVCGCVLCAVCCVLCAVCCVLCAVCCVLCAGCVLCAVCCVLCAVCCVQC